MDIETKSPLPAGEPSGLIGRAKRIILTPKAEWNAIAAEPMTVEGIYTKWVVIMAAIPAIAGLVGALAFGYSAFGITYRPTVAEAVSSAVMQYLGALAGVYLLALVIDWLAPRFGGSSDRIAALKVAAFSATAAWLSGIFAILPGLAFLNLLGLYSLYLLHSGLPRLMKAPQDKAMGYTVVTIIAAFVLVMAISAIIQPIAAIFS